MLWSYLCLFLIVCFWMFHVFQCIEVVAIPVIKGFVHHYCCPFVFLTNECQCYCLCLFAVFVLCVCLFVWVVCWLGLFGLFAASRRSRGFLFRPFRQRIMPEELCSWQVVMIGRSWANRRQMVWSPGEFFYQNPGYLLYLGDWPTKVI